MMGNDTFDVLVLIGRPASGKSEIIDFLKHTAPDVRRSRYHIAELEVMDDFPTLWTWFEEDRILSQRLGQPHLYTDEDGYFKQASYWHLLIERLSLDYQKRRRDDPAYHDHTTALVEFSRGSEHGGCARTVAVSTRSVQTAFWSMAYPTKRWSDSTARMIGGAWRRASPGSSQSVPPTCPT